MTNKLLSFDIINFLWIFNALVSIVLVSIYLILLIRFIKGWKKIAEFRPKLRVPKTMVSVLVAARNEEENIGFTIDDILMQDYPKDKIEIIIVDDHSTDKTPFIIRAYANQGVKLIQLNEGKSFNSYKKMAIEKAIAAAQGSLIVTTDADCRMGTKWISTLVSFYEENDYKLISSPVAYYEEQNLFEKAQSLEFSYLIGIGASTIGNGHPNTCNGANLAYEKSAFYDVGGFKGIDDLASGDDELLLHKISAKFRNKIGFLKNNEAIVYTKPKPDLPSFIAQRRRWASKSTKYKEKSMSFLVLSVWLFNLSILFNLFLILLGFSSLNFILLFQLTLKVGFEFIYLIQITTFFKRKNLLFLHPLLTLIHILYIVYIGIAGNRGKYQWKGRMVR